MPTNQSLNGFARCLLGDGGGPSCGTACDEIQLLSVLVGELRDALEAVCATSGGSLKLDVQDLWCPFLVGIEGKSSIGEGGLGL